MFALASLGLAAAGWGSQRAGDSVVPGGPLDETAHLLTTLLVVWALGRRTSERYLVAALIASLAIDVDHVPDRLGIDWITAGTPRPYTHSLLTIVVVLLAAAWWRRRRTVLVGVALGLGIHFWRDLAEPASGVSLLWPVSRHSFSFSHGGYLGMMLAVVLIDAWRCRSPRPFGPVVPRPSSVAAIRCCMSLSGSMHGPVPCTVAFASAKGEIRLVAAQT